MKFFRETAVIEDKNIMPFDTIPSEVSPEKPFNNPAWTFYDRGSNESTGTYDRSTTIDDDERLPPPVITYSVKLKKKNDSDLNSEYTGLIPSVSAHSFSYGIAKYPTHQREYCISSSNKNIVWIGHGVKVLQLFSFWASCSASILAIVLITVSIYYLTYVDQMAVVPTPVSDLVICVLGISFGCVSVLVEGLHAFGYFCCPSVFRFWKSGYHMVLHCMIFSLSVLPLVTRSSYPFALLFSLHIIPILFFYIARIRKECSSKIASVAFETNEGV